jgi:L-serine dehydratase
MRTAGMFVDELVAGDLVDHVADVRVDLYGSLTATGAGHGTLSAILLGLEGDRPETIETELSSRSPNPTSRCTRSGNSTTTRMP